MTWSNVGGADGCDTIPDRVYCSDTAHQHQPAGLDEHLPWNGATFITPDHINIGANNAIDLQPAAGAPLGLIMAAYGNGGSATCGADTINMGTARDVHLQGKIYAPNGCIWTAGAAPSAASR